MANKKSNRNSRARIGSAEQAGATRFDAAAAPAGRGAGIWFALGVVGLAALVVWGAMTLLVSGNKPQSPASSTSAKAVVSEKPDSANSAGDQANKSSLSPEAGQQSQGRQPESAKSKTAQEFQASVIRTELPTAETPEGMVWIPGGEFSMGCLDPTGLPSGGPDQMNDARPIVRTSVNGFWMDKTEVTNAQFAKFVEATGYVTVAEKAPRAEDFPDAPPENLVAGSVVFTPPENAVLLDNHFQWWAYIKGANWRHPLGPESNLEGKDNYPVVHVAVEDVLAFCKWAGKRLPTEAEWEFAARGGQTGLVYAWGNQFRPDGKWMANTFQGQFPIRDTAQDGFAGIAPVGQFPANPYGLQDIAGNVWEWCADWYRADYYQQLSRLDSPVLNPQGPEDSWDPAEPGAAKRVHRGGSFLCTDQYCTRYMIGTRGKGEQSTGTNHIGFRCVRDVAPPVEIK